MPSHALTVDFHNHLMPGVDDGAGNLADSRSGLAALRDVGIRDIIAAVHFDASLQASPAELADRLDAIDEGYARLEALVRAEYPTLRLRRGAEVNLDTPNLDFSDARLRLGGTRFVLVEFPGLQMPPFGARLLAHAGNGGWQPVLAHPERYRGTAEPVHAAAECTAAGAWLQLNHGSLTGRYGRAPQTAAADLLAAGLISYLSSDYHCRDTTWIAETAAAIRDESGGEEILAAFELNAQRLLADVPPLPVPPLQRPRGFLQRLGELVRGRRPPHATP